MIVAHKYKFFRLESMMG